MFAYTPYAIPIFLGALFAATLAAVSWRFRQQSVANRIYFWYMVVLSLWQFGHTIQFLVVGLEAKIAVVNVEYLGITLTAMFWVLFALAYTGRAHWLSRRVIGLLLIHPVLVQITIWTDPYHHLFRRSIRLGDELRVSRLVTDFGIAFWIHSVYSYILLLFGWVLLSQFWLRQRHIYRSQTAMVLLSTLAPWFANVLFLTGITPIDLTPFGFTITALALGWGLFRYRLLRLRPVAHATVFNNMSDAVLIIDGHNQLVTYNPAALELLDLPGDHIIGRQIEPFLDVPAPLINQFRHETAVETEIQLRHRYFDLRITPFRDQRTADANRIITLRDITSRKEAELALQTTLNRTNALFQVSQQVMDLTRIEDLFETMLATVIATLPAHHANVVGLDLDQEAITFFAESGADHLYQQTPTFADLMAGLVGWAIRERQPALSTKTRPDAREAAHIQAQRKAADVGAVLVVPLIHRGRILGGMTVVNLRQQPDFTKADANLLLALANPAAQARLFTPFERLDETEVEGHGLGLAIVKRIVDKLGGEVTLESTRGSGSTFGFRLSSAPPTATGAAPPRANAS